MPLEHIVEGALVGLHEDGEPPRRVNPARPVVEGLQGQADAQVSAVPLEDAEVPSDHVVEHFVPAAEAGGGGRMSFWFRLAVYLPVLFLIAIVVVGQHHDNARDTLRGAIARTVRWTVWSAVLVGGMFALEFLFIGW